MTAVMMDNSSSFVVPLVDLVYNAQFFFFFFFNFYFKMSSSTANETSYDWKLDFVPCSSMPWLISSTMRKKNCSWCPKGHDEKHGWDGLFAPFFGLILLHTLCTRIRQCQCPSHSALATTFFVTLLVAAILSFNDNCTPAELPRPACRQNIFSTFVNPITVKNYLIAGFFDNEGPEECSSWQVNNSILGANGPHFKTVRSTLSCACCHVPVTAKIKISSWILRSLSEMTQQYTTRSIILCQVVTFISRATRGYVPVSF